MNGYSPIDEHQPVLWLRGHGIYASYLVVLGYVASMVVTTVVLAANAGPLLEWLTFGSVDVLRGQVWRLATYGLVNPPSLPFVVDMFLIGWFGREVERTFGRRAFLQLFACLYFLSPLWFTALGRWLPASFAGERDALAIFVAFATLNPGVAVFFNLLAQWMAFILIGIFSLMDLAYHNWIGLITLWSTCGFAHGFVRHQQGRLELPDLRFWRRRPQLRVLPDLDPPVRVRPRAAPDPSMVEMDALLDKIARSGLSSLTLKERTRLDAARAELLRKKQ